MQPKIKSHLSGKCLLITGASGYLASNLVNSIKEIPCKICRLSRSHELPPLEGVALYEDFYGDIQEPSVWERAMKEVDVVFHFAAQTNLYVAEKDPIKDYQANVLPMSLMLEASKKMGNDLM